MSEKYIQRITLDIDGFKPKLNLYHLDSLIQKINNIYLSAKFKNIKTKLIKKYGFQNTFVRKSPSGRGLHVIAWHKTGFCKKKMLKIRRELGDDLMRIKLDSRTNRQINVLFDEKWVENK